MQKKKDVPQSVRHYGKLPSYITLCFRLGYQSEDACVELLLFVTMP